MMSLWSSSSGISVENDLQSSPLATFGCSHEKLAAVGSWRKRTPSPPLYMLSNTCRNGGVHPTLHCFPKNSPFSVLLLKLWLMFPPSSECFLVTCFVYPQSWERFLGSCVSIHLCVHICVEAESCFSGRPCRTDHRRTCRSPSSSSSSFEAQNQSHSAPRQQRGPQCPASLPEENETIIDVSMQHWTTNASANAK